jgi:Polysaccharide pyruvyl transferase
MILQPEPRKGVAGGAVVLNDTDTDGRHFGCMRVMANIEALAAGEGITIAARIKAGTRPDDQGLLDAVSRARLVSVNGEGTLHHGRRKAGWLIEAMANAKASGRPVALINALWQDNPDAWAQSIATLDIIATRDTRSADAIEAATGRSVYRLGDLSLYGAAPAHAGSRRGLVFGDSVSGAITSKLAALARQCSATGADVSLMPVVTSLKSPIAPFAFLAPFRRFYARVAEAAYVAQNHTVRFASNEAEYLSCVGSAALSVTGRFHAVCLAVLTRTPFVAVASNSWKIDALIRDIGLDPRRMQPVDALDPLSLASGGWDFAPHESAAIDRFLERQQSQSQSLFAAIAALAGPKA